MVKIIHRYEHRAKKKNAKNDFEKDFSKLINKAVFGKTMQNVSSYRDISPARTEARRNDLLLEPNYHTTKCFSETHTHTRKYS